MFTFKHVKLSYSGAEIIEACRATIARSTISAANKLPDKDMPRLNTVIRGLRAKDRYELDIDEAVELGL
jgi:hypothetical protein